MNAKTLEAVTKHGNSLLAAFPNATEQNTVALCKKLRRIETVAHRAATDYCNGTPCHAVAGRVFHFGNNETDWDDFCGIIEKRAGKLLGESELKDSGFFVNGDARGYTLKLSDDWTRRVNAAWRELGNPELQIHTDMGGYGILAPELDD